MASDLDQQLTQLDELLGLLDGNALRSAQEAIERQIAELNERLEVTRRALAKAQLQRRRLARARLLLEDSNSERNSSGDPALKPVPAESPAKPKPPATITAPFAVERRQGGDRRTSPDRRTGTDRRKDQSLPPAV